MRVFSIFTIIIGLALISLSSARPTLGLRAPTDPSASCTALKPFYRCQKNGFVGCCSVDPCAMDTCPDPIEPHVPSWKRPATQKARQATPTCVPGVAQPNLYDIYAGNKTFAGNCNDDLSLSQDDPLMPAHQQVAYFQLPPGAQNCSLTWQIGWSDQRDFNQSGNGLVDVYSVDLAEAPEWYTWNSIVPYSDTQVAQGAFDDGWANKTEASIHQMGMVGCREDLLLRLGISGTDAGQVSLKQDSENGLFLSYAC